MRKLPLLLVLVVALVGVPAGMTMADDPSPIIIVDPPPAIPPGADLKIRPANGSQGFIGKGSRGPGQGIDEHITQGQRAAAVLKVCNVGSRRAVRVHGPRGGLNWRVRYFVGSREITRAVGAGHYWTRRLGNGDCARMTMTARLKFTGDEFDHVFKVVGVPHTGARDAVTLRAHIDGPLVVP